MVLEPESFPLRTLRRRAKAQLPKPAGSFAGKTVLITGASGSICSEAARIFIELGVDTLVFGVRNVIKGAEIAKTLTGPKESDDGPPKILVWSLDVTSFESVKGFAGKVSKLPRLDNVVIGQAVINTTRKETPDGWEESKTVFPVCVYITNKGLR
jgi:retinol dehydrogenase-12